MNETHKNPLIAIAGMEFELLKINTEDPWMIYLRQCLLKSAELYGVTLFDKVPQNKMSLCKNVKYDGEIIIGGGAVDFIKYIHQVPIHLPRILLNRIAKPEHKITSISVDQYFGTFKATQALLEMGHTRISTDCSGDKTQPGIQRMQGYYDAFKNAGVAIDDSMLLGYAHSDDTKLHYIRNILQRKDRPTAFILGSCGPVENLLELVHSFGIKIPQDISLIIIDDSMELSSPEFDISVVTQPLEQMTAEGIRIIKQLIDGGKNFCENILLKPELVVRNSIAKAKTDI
jgi:DNA-binding LacI/PurR family transcriptional regulator